ncbi:MAG: ribose 5-phosphate isomerase B [Oscillospiraceae bacterium]|nr:ribose 5-phosphate isomerase B [Oscillospiraceae bacterium]
MKIGFASDHAAVALKDSVKAHLAERGFECVDFGAYEPTEQDNYPERGLAVAEALVRGEIDKGVIVCGTGIGISLAANKVPGIRAAVCGDTYTARLSVEHNNANILAMGARVVAPEYANDIADAFFDARFEGGRHAVRVGMIADIEKKYSKVPGDA